MGNVIRHKLDLVIRLIDTTTGIEIKERNVRFFRGQDKVSPLPRGGGTYAFMNTGRDDCELAVEVYGFDRQTVPIRYDELDDYMPSKEVFLIPSENNLTGEDVLTFSGKVSNLTAIDAVILGQARSYIKEFDERKRIMTLYNQGSLSEDESYYGLIHGGDDAKSFEFFEVGDILSPITAKLKEPLAEPFTPNDPISRVIFGQVSPKGDFILRVRDNSDNLKALVRYTLKDGKRRFEVHDFHPQESEVV